jgi:hypothetical protein
MQFELSLKGQQAIRDGLVKYNYLMSTVNNCDITQNEDFKRVYNNFYRMRQRPAMFYNTYYQFMEDNKQSGVNFEKTLTYFYETLGRVEASFSSKLVATINPKMPVWDKYVLENLGLTPPSSTSKNRLEALVNIYDKITEYYDEYLGSEKCMYELEYFDKLFPDQNSLSKLKKIDLIRWQTR